jgi:hypothetical protein
MTDIRVLVEYTLIFTVKQNFTVFDFQVAVSDFLTEQT